MIYRWLEPNEIETLVNPTLKQRGWAELNINEETPTCRVLGAFLEDGQLIESFTMQLYPMLGPMARHNTEIRDSGEVSRRLAAIMEEFLVAANARDFLAVADSPVTERLCARFKMKKILSPVFVKHNGEQ